MTEDKRVNIPAWRAVKNGIVILYGIIFALFLQKAIEVRGVGDFWNASLIPIVLYGATLYLLFWKAYSRLLSNIFELDKAYVSKVDAYSYAPTLLLLQYFLFYPQVDVPFEQKLLSLVFVSVCVLKAGQLIFLYFKARRLRPAAFIQPATLGLFLLIPAATFVFIRSYDYLLYKSIEPRLIVGQMKEASINNEVRQVLYSPSPYLPGGNRIEKQAPLPQDAMMSFGIGVVKNSWFQSDTGVEFNIYVGADGRKERIYSRFLDPRKNPPDLGWVDETVDLAEYSGQTVTLIFETKVPYSETASLKKILKSSFGYTKWLNIGKYGSILEAVWSAPKIFPKDHEQGPNVILISFDTLGARHLECYGYRFKTAPHLSRLADGGVLFRQCVVQAPWTLPSHASLLSGQNCSTHGVVTSDHRLADSFVTLAEVFQEDGYQTAAITEGGNVSSAFGLNQGFDSYDNGNVQDVGRTFGKAIEWLESRRNGKFFLFLHTYETHAYYRKRQPYYSNYSRGYKGLIRGDFPVLGQPKSTPFYFRPEDVEELSALYDSEVSYVDSYFKKLEDKLEELNLKETTTVVVTSDHGEGFGEHAYFGHGNTLHDELLLVPLIMSGPELPRGLVLDPQVRSIDLMPTLIELQHLPIPEGLDGVSLVPLLRGKEMETRPALSEVDEHAYGTLKKSLRTDSMKLVVQEGQEEVELYDLVKDPAEEIDLSRSNARSAEQIKSRLEAELALCARKNARMLGPRETAGRPLKDDATLDRLKALGYLN